MPRSGHTLPVIHAVKARVSPGRTSEHGVDQPVHLVRPLVTDISPLPHDSRGAPGTTLITNVLCCPATTILAAQSTGQPALPPPAPSPRGHMLGQETILGRVGYQVGQTR